MSMFVCTDTHISIIVAYAVAHGVIPDARKAGATLKRANELVYIRKYEDGKGEFSKFVYTPPKKLPNKVQLYKWCSCYMYQCNESCYPAWHNGRSVARKLITRIMEACVGSAEEQDRIDVTPAYEAAAWFCED